jgi:hypothetical protein
VYLRTFKSEDWFLILPPEIKRDDGRSWEFLLSQTKLASDTDPMPRLKVPFWKLCDFHTRDIFALLLSPFPQ